MDTLKLIFWLAGSNLVTALVFYFLGTARGYEYGADSAIRMVNEAQEEISS